MGRIDGTSRNTDRLDGVAERFQVSTHLVECHLDDARHILTKEPSGPDSVKAADNFRPEIAVVVKTFSFSCKTERLAGEPPTHEVNRLDRVPIDLLDVAISGDVGPVLGEHALTPEVVFNLPPNFHTCSFKSKIEPSNPSKE